MDSHFNFGAKRSRSLHRISRALAGEVVHEPRCPRCEKPLGDQAPSHKVYCSRKCCAAAARNRAHGRAVNDMRNFCTNPNSPNHKFQQWRGEEAEVTNSRWVKERA